MTVLRDIALIVVALSGTATVLVREPTRQTVVSGFFGLALALFLFVYGAPDVALSEIVVATVVVPIMALLALAKIRESERDR